MSIPTRGPTEDDATWQARLDQHVDAASVVDAGSHRAADTLLRFAARTELLTCVRCCTSGIPMLLFGLRLLGYGLLPMLETDKTLLGKQEAQQFLLAPPQRGRYHKRRGVPDLLSPIV